MPTTNDDENPSQPEPNWVDKWMLYVSAAGVVAVVFYGWQAWVANGLTRQLIGEGSRPYVQIIVDPRQQVKKVVVAKNENSLINNIGITYALINNGKLPGKGKLRAIVKWSPVVLSDPPDISQAPIQEEFIWPNLVGTAPFTAVGTDDMTVGEFADLRNGTGCIYFRAEMTYGDDGQYTTSVCWQISLTKANDDVTSQMMAKLGYFSLWPDDSRECPTTAN